MTETGWISVYRKIQNSFVWTNSDQLKLWLLVLMKVNHESNKFLFNGQEVCLNSGQMVTGRDALGIEFNRGVKHEHQVSAVTLWRWIKKFKSEQMLNIKSNSKYSVITVINWNQYQQGEQQLNITRSSHDHHLFTNNNDNNDNNVNKEYKSKKSTPTYDDQSPYLILAKELFEEIRKNNPETKKPNLQNWANVMRLMVERDKRTTKKISNMIKWSQNDDFWSGVVLSASSLRKDYDKMASQANRVYGKRTVAKETLPDWAENNNQVNGTQVTQEDQERLKERLRKLRENAKTS